MIRKENLYLSIAKIEGAARGVAYLIEKFDEPKNGVYGLWISCTHVVGESNDFSTLVSKAGRYPIFEEILELEIEKQSPIGEKDITLLISRNPLPTHLVPLPTNHEWNSRGNTVCLFGFPQDSMVNGTFEDDIVISSVRITDRNNNPQISFKSTEITEGFSGSPIYDSNHGVVIGMAVEISNRDKNDRRVSNCYGIPMSVIGRYLPEIELFPIAPISEERVSLSSLSSLNTIQSIGHLKMDDLALRDKIERNYFIRELKRGMFGAIDDDMSKHLPTTLFYEIISGNLISKDVEKDLSLLIGDEAAILKVEKFLRLASIC